MGVPTGGAGLGSAQGRISIDVSALQAAQIAVQNASRQMTAAMNQISPSAQRAQVSINQLKSAVQQLGGIFGVTFGAAGVAQLARFVVEADALATAYRRQNLAAVSLAGSQEELNALLRTYQQVSGGATDSATALANVTNLMSVGFADSVEELERFSTAIRGISIARGVSQEFVTQNLILELFSQRGQRLDQLGLDYEKVRQAAERLRQTDRSVTQETAYQLAVLEQAIARYGALTRSVEGAATGMELLRRSLSDARLEIGQTVGPAADLFGTFAATAIILEIGKLRALTKAFNEDIQEIVASWQLLLRLMGLAQAPSAPGVSTTSTTGTPARARFSEDQTAAIVEWARQVEEIERQSARDRLDATRQFERQRSDTIRQYEQSIAREAQDFAISRARAEEDYQISLLRIRRDIGQREASQLADLERTIADARSAASERGAERQAELDERLAETRANSQDRIVELEADFARQRERSQRTFARQIRDAAANLDAVQVRELQTERREALAEAQQDFDERLEKERKNEAKRLADLEKAHSKQTTSEGRALQKRIDEAEEAYQRQLEDARAADEQRLTDMAADFQLRQERENEDRALRLERLAEDHQAQLEELARQHEERLLQIADQEQDERTLLDEEFQKELDALGLRTQAYREKLKEYETAAIEAFDRVWAHWLGAMQGPQALNPLITPGQFPSLGGLPPASSSVTNSNARTINFNPTIIAPSTFAPDERTAQWFMGLLADLLEGLPQ